jgi:hypothetical protein
LRRRRIGALLAVIVAILAVVVAPWSWGASSKTRAPAVSKTRGPAATPESGPAANLWVDRSGGSCSRAGTPGEYRDGAACGSIVAAWNACRPGDTIEIKAGTYGAQTISGDKASPGCEVKGEDGTTIGALVTSGDFFTLDNVVVDVGSQKNAGWKDTASNVSLSDVRFHGPFVSIEISGASNIRWTGGELGVAGQLGGPRVCGEDAEPVQIEDSNHIVFDGIHFHPQDADPTPNACSANGFHLEMMRLDGGTAFFTLSNSTFDSGDRSGTASIFITEPGGFTDPHDLTFENDFFGTNDSVGAIDVHSNVNPCLNFTFAYNTFLQSAGAFQCESAVNMRWIGNLGASYAGGSCLGTYTDNVWQDSAKGSCGTDKWVLGTRGQTDRLGLGGPDGFHLQAGSPAINAGEKGGYCLSTLHGLDHDGQGRPRGVRCDAGADEYNVPGSGPVDVTVAATPPGLASPSSRVLHLPLAVKEAVSADVRLVRGGRTLARWSLRLRPGQRTPTLRLNPSISPGTARLRLLLQDSAGNQKVLSRSVRVSK